MTIRACIGLDQQGAGVPQRDRRFAIGMPRDFVDLEDGRERVALTVVAGVHGRNLTGILQANERLRAAVFTNGYKCSQR